MSDLITDDITVIEIVGEHEIPCELGKKLSGACDNKAEWVMFRTPNMCGCGSRPPALACTDCKDFRIASEDAVICPGCGTAIVPARLGYSRIEAL